MGHVLGDHLQGRGDAMLSEARADHRACAPGNLHRMLLDVSHATASHRDLKSLLCDLAGLLRRVARFDRLAIVLHDPERDVMRLHTIVSLEPTFTTDLELPVPESPAGLVWQTQRPLVVPRIDRETRFAEVRRILRAEGMRSCCVLPLTTPLRRLGGLSFASQDEDAFSDSDVEVLQELTTQVALAVDNTLHHEAARQAQQQLACERDRLQLLFEVNNALVSNLEPRVLFSEIATCLRRVVAHDYTSLAVYDRERNAFDMWALEFAGKGLIKEHMFVPVEGSPAGTAFTAGEPARFGRADLAALESDVGRALLAEGIQSMCSVPLTVHDRRLGTLSIGRLGAEAFTDCDAELLASVASQVAFSVENALAFQEIAQLKDKLAAEKVYLEDEIRTEYNFEDIIGESSALKRVLHQVETVAPTDSAVLIRGETCTGKELIARAIHDLSGRRGRTFVKVNCAAIPTGLLESELFGHERGAFTGAIAQRIGRFELADGGTLFLDEVGDIPLELQPKLLRVLQEREFERLGSTRTIRVDVRLIAATNRDLAQMATEKQFRTDLYFRLNVFPIRIPPLRERVGDIPLLVRYYVDNYSQRMNKRIDVVPEETMAELCRYSWPGNIRELQNLIERSVIMTPGDVLQIQLNDLQQSNPISSTMAGTLEDVERQRILEALREAGAVIGGRHGAAVRLGLKRTTLLSKMQRLGIARNTNYAPTTEKEGSNVLPQPIKR